MSTHQETRRGASMRHNAIMAVKAIGYTTYGAAALLTGFFAAFAATKYLSDDEVVRNAVLIADAVVLAPVAHSIGRGILRVIRELAEGK